ncbi:MAG: GNAT family N-acetyltransferase [Nitrospira sp.]|nr:MAG: GNAT family N-acetyltransferase [Nitrospira sp.]
MSDHPSELPAIQAMRGVSIAPDPWLATIMNREVHRVTGMWDESDRSTARQKLRELILRPGFAFAKVATQDVRTSHELEEYGFRIVDTALTLETRGLSTGGTVSARVRKAIPEDASAVVNIARQSFRFSRFHLDPDIPPGLANEIKARWAGNFFSRQRGDHMVVAEQDGRVVGFLQLIAAADSVLVIDLIAVQPDARGMGLAAGMIEFANQACGRPRMVRAGTQSANLPSLALYHKLGFQVVSTSHMFHLHGPSR